MGQIKNIKLHIGTDIKKLNLYRKIPGLVVLLIQDAAK